MPIPPNGTHMKNKSPPPPHYFEKRIMENRKFYKVPYVGGGGTCMGGGGTYMGGGGTYMGGGGLI